MDTETVEVVPDGDRSGPPRLAHVPALDGLRGAAVLAVVCFHGGHLRGGYLGVDLFFVLSGYLITSLLLLEAGGSGRIDLLRFWGRRARRLLPALGVLLVLVAAYARLVADPGELHRIRWDGLATLFYVANWREIFGRTDYFALFAAPSPLAHTWSLAIEEQFYLVWPLVLGGLAVVVRRRIARTGGAAGARDGRSSSTETARAVLALSIALLVVSGLLQVVLGHVDGWNRVYMGTDTRAFALLAGAAVAAVPAWRGPVVDGRGRRLLEGVGIVGALLLLAAWVTLDGGSALARHGALPLCSLAAAAVVAAIAQPQPGALARVLSFRPLCWLGLISYGVYLYHWPVDVWLDADRTGWSGWPLFALQCVVTLAVAIVSYRFVEQPIRRGVTWRATTKVLTMGGGVVVVAVLLVAGTSTSALDRLDVSDTALGGARRAPHGSGPTTAVFGDSVGFFLGKQGIDRLRTEPHMNFVNDAKPACTFPTTDESRTPDGSVYPAGTFDCDARWMEVIRAYRVTNVLFVTRSRDPDTVRHGGRPMTPCSPEFDAWYRTDMNRWIHRFAGAGAHTFLVTMPAATRMFGESEAHQAAEDRAATCDRRAKEAVAAADPRDVTLIDLAGRICPTTSTCAKDWGGTELRPDGLHFKGRGAQVVAAWVLGQMGVRATVP